MISMDQCTHLEPMESRTALRTSLLESNILGNENFQPPSKFCMRLGTQGDAQKCPF